MGNVTPTRVYRVENGRFKHTWGPSVPFKYYDLRVNGEKLVELSAVPLHLKELGIGFLVSNAYVEDVASIEGISVEDGTIEVRATPDFEFRARAWKERGIVPLEELDIPPVTSGFSVSSEKIYEKLSSVLNEADLPFYLISDVNGYLFYAEDVRSENAFYKVVGRAVTDHFDLRESFLVTSSIVLPEDVVRAAYLGIPALGTTSVPTDLSVAVAESLGVTLFAVGIDGIRVYSHPSRIQ